ncbi:AraC family transcriptional regulator [Kamptonema cortianum]|nr:AraC family transcriptional regulator [Kamptonema cortianum]
MPQDSIVSFLEFPLRIFAVNATVLGQWWEQDDYSAPYWRLYWNEESGAEVVCKKVRVALNPDRIVLIPPDTPFMARLRRPVRHFFMHFMAGSAGRVTIDRGVYPIRCESIHQELLGRIDSKGEVADCGRQRNLLTAMALISLCLSECAGLREDKLDHHEKVHQAMEMIKSRIDTPPDNATLARAVGMNPNAFIRLFAKETGWSPQAWGARLRIEQACLLLHHSNHKIDRIASECGFCDRYHFSRVFRQVRGTTPAAFRKTAQIHTAA